MTQFEKDRLAAHNAAQYEANLSTYKNWITKHPNIMDCVANLKMFQEYIDWTNPISEAEFEFALGNLGGRMQLAKQRVPSEAEVKQELIDTIIERLQSTNNQHWQVPHNVQIERTKMNFWDLAQLTARLNEVVRAQQINAMSPVERRQIAYGTKEAPSNWPKLPLRMVPRGQVTSIAVDADHLNNLARNDKYEFARLCKIYGCDSIDRRRGIK